MATVVPTTLPFAQQLYLLGRPANVTLPALVFLVGYVVGGGSLFVNDWRLFVIAVSGFLIHSGLTILNDLIDKSIDVDNSVSTIITRGSPNAVTKVKIGAAGCIAIGALLAVALQLQTVLLLIAMAALGVAYSVKPLVLSRRPFASIIALGLLYGTFPFLVGYSMYAQEFSVTIVVAAMFWGLARASLSILKDFKDVRGDKKHGKRTFLLHTGRRATIATSNGLTTVGLIGVSLCVLPFVSHSYRYAYLITLVVAVGVILLTRVKLSRTKGGENDLFQRLLLLQILFDGGILLWVSLP